MATTGSRVLFSYIPTGKTKPVSPDANTIYFLEAAQEIHVGDKVIATNVSASIPTITVTGSGDYVSNAVYDLTNKKVITPNDLLGVSYIKTIIENNYKIEPITIKRRFKKTISK